MTKITNNSNYDIKTINNENMKKFYDTIAEKYDYIFPLTPLQKKFFSSNIKGKFILDVGAATGNLTEYLLEKGFYMSSIDINRKLINKALEKGIPVMDVNMLEINIFKEFDTIINIGNTLPHLHNMEEVYEFLKKSYDLLKENGIIIIQIINFHKFIKQKDENNFLGSLPLIKNEKVKFERSYYLDNKGNIIFRTILDEKEENEEILLNISYEMLKKYLLEIGFKNIKAYGGFDETEFDIENSIHLIVTGSR